MQILKSMKSGINFILRLTITNDYDIRRTFRKTGEHQN